MTGAVLAYRRPDIPEVTIAGRLETLVMDRAVDLGNEVIKTGTLSFLFQHGIDGSSEVESIRLSPLDRTSHIFPESPTEEHSSRLLIFSQTIKNQLLWKPDGVKLGHFNKSGGATRRFLYKDELWSLAMSLENSDYQDVIDQIVRVSDLEKKVLRITGIWNTAKNKRNTAPEDGWSQF